MVVRLLCRCISPLRSYAFLPPPIKSELIVISGSSGLNAIMTGNFVRFLDHGLFPVLPVIVKSREIQFSDQFNEAGILPDKIKQPVGF